MDAHIPPGGDFLDIQGEFSDQHTKLRFMMAGTAELEGAFRRHGVSNDSRVVLLVFGSPMWADTQILVDAQVARIQTRVST